MKKYFTGSLFVIWMFVTSVSGIAAGNVAFFLAFGGAVDVKERIIPNRVCAFIALTGLCEVLTGSGEFFYKAISIFIAFTFLLLLKLIAKKGIGFGDIKLLMACSLSLGLYSLMTGLALASFCAAVAGFVGKKTLKGEVAFGPYLAIGITLCKMAESV